MIRVVQGPKDSALAEAIVAAQAAAEYGPMSVWYRSVHGINQRGKKDLDAGSISFCEQ